MLQRNRRTWPDVTEPADDRAEICPKSVFLTVMLKCRYILKAQKAPKNASLTFQEGQAPSVCSHHMPATSVGNDHHSVLRCFVSTSPTRHWARAGPRAGPTPGNVTSLTHYGSLDREALWSGTGNPAGPGASFGLPLARDAEAMPVQLCPWAHVPLFSAWRVDSCFRVHFRYQFFPDPRWDQPASPAAPSTPASTAHQWLSGTWSAAPLDPEQRESRGPQRPGPHGVSGK